MSVTPSPHHVSSHPHPVFEKKIPNKGSIPPHPIWENIKHYPLPLTITPHGRAANPASQPTNSPHTHTHTHTPAKLKQNNWQYCQSSRKEKRRDNGEKLRKIRSRPPGQFPPGQAALTCGSHPIWEKKERTHNVATWWVSNPMRARVASMWVTIWLRFVSLFVHTNSRVAEG